MAYDEAKALALLKERLDRLPTDTTKDTTLKTRLQAADEELQEMGITLVATRASDTELLADYAAWKYLNREEKGKKPEWLTDRTIGRAVHQSTLDDAS